MSQRLHILSVDLLDDVALQQAAAPLGIQDHFHLLAQRAVCNGEAETPWAFNQRHAHELWLQQSGVRTLQVVGVMVVVGVRVWVVAPPVSHWLYCSSLPRQGRSLWDFVMRVLWGGGGGRRGRVFGGADASRGLLTAAGVLGQRVAAAQHHVHVLVEGYGLEHLHHISVSLSQHTCAIDVHDDITWRRRSKGLLFLTLTSQLRCIHEQSGKQQMGDESRKNKQAV